MAYNLRIQHYKTIYEPVIEDTVTLTRDKNGKSTLKFTVLMDENIVLSEGDVVTFTGDELKPVGMNNIFYGYIFGISAPKKKRVEVTAYDQIRYLGNQDSYAYENKTLTELLQMICNDNQIKYGPDIMATDYVIASRIEENKTYLDMIKTAIELTAVNTGREFILWDNFGEIALHDTDFHKIDLILSDETCGSFNFSTNIDEQTYTQVKLTRTLEDQTTETFLAKDDNTIGKWGLLQYTGSVEDGENGDEKAKQILEQTSRPVRKVSMSECLGDVRVRGGTSVFVKLDIGANLEFSYAGITYSGYMMVDTVSHRFSHGIHTMDVSLSRGMRGN